MDGIMDRSRIGIRCYPISDERFGAAVRAVVEALSDDDLTARSLASQLATAYPAIKVVGQEPLAVLGSSRVLYVYRDGHP
jgi:hypothetical protein